MFLPNERLLRVGGIVRNMPREKGQWKWRGLEAANNIKDVDRMQANIKDEKDIYQLKRRVVSERHHVFHPSALSGTHLRTAATNAPNNQPD